MLTEGPRDLILNVYIEIVHMHALFKWFIKQFYYHNHINRFFTWGTNIPWASKRYCTERFRAEENGRVLWFVRRLIKWQFLLLRQKALLCRDGHEGWRERCTERIYGMMQNCGVRLHQQLCYEMPTVDLFTARVWQPSVATRCPRASSYHKKTVSHMPPLATHGSLCTRDWSKRT